MPDAIPNDSKSREPLPTSTIPDSNYVFRKTPVAIAVENTKEPSSPIIIALVRLLALYWIVEILSQIGTVFMMLPFQGNFYGGGGPSIAVYFIGFTVKFVLSFLVFVYAPSLARILSAQRLFNRPEREF